MNTLQQLLHSKQVGYFAGFALLFNQMTGPGIPFTAANFQNPGWLPTTLLYILFCNISGFSILFLIEAIQAIPGNSHFQGNVEYSTAIYFFFGPKAHLMAQFALYFALQSNAIQSIVLISQGFDMMMCDWFGHSCGLTVGLKWMCVASNSSFPSPFGDTFMLFTVGFLVLNT